MKVIPIQTYTNRRQPKIISFKNNSATEPSLPTKNADTTQFKENVSSSTSFGKRIKEGIKTFFTPRPFAYDYSSGGDPTDKIIATIPYMY